MAISSLHLATPVRRRPPLVPRDHARRDRAIALFDEGRHLEATREVLHYLLPQHAIPSLDTEPFCFAQGSARIRVRLEDGDLSLTSTLAAMRADTQLAAALRYFLTHLSSTGQMFQPRLRDGTVALEFREPLARVHPQKLIEVLHKLPLEASTHDAWMADEFAVDLPDREPYAPLDAEELERAQRIWSAHWAAVEELVTESRRRRSIALLNLLGAFAYNHVAYALPLHGSVLARLKDDAQEFNDRDENPNKRDATLGKCVKAMKQVDAEKLRACLGHATWAINPLAEGTPATLASVLGSGQRAETTGKLRAAGRTLEAALEWISVYVYLVAEFAWPAPIEAALRAGLDAASDVPWSDAADVLARHASQTAREHGRDEHGHDERGAADSDPGYYQE